MPKKEDLTGKRFGRLTVLKEVPKPENKKVKGSYWECKCDCGNTTTVSAQVLKKGEKRSCGCLKKETNKRNLRSRKADMSVISKRYNDITITGITNQKDKSGRALYKCHCELCGNDFLKGIGEIKRGNIKNCGCKKHEPKDNLIGQRFGRLTVIDKTVENNTLYYIAKCDCGNSIKVSGAALKDGNTKSCGCYKKDKVKELYVEGTAPCKIKNPQKLRKTNTSGVTGVRFNEKRGMWEAEIWFKKVHYHLGRFGDFKEAVKARRIAEEKMFEDFLEWYEKEYKTVHKDEGEGE